MTRQRGPLYLLLAVVAGAAAVLSFAALRDLALLCGFAPALSPLLPVTVDAGAAAGSIVWLSRWTPPGARTYGRALALLLLASSVGGNALGHGLDAYSAHPHWLVVVGVSAIAPTVLGALVHLVVLVLRSTEPVETAAATVADLPAEPAADEPERIALHLAPEPTNAVPTPPAGIPVVKRASAATTRPVTSRARVAPDLAEKAAPLIAAGYGRERLADELGITTPQARKLLDDAKGAK